MAFFNALNTKHWWWAWTLEGQYVAPGQTYERWLHDYQTPATHNDNITITSTHGKKVTVLLVAIQASRQAQIFHKVYRVNKGPKWPIVLAGDTRNQINLQPWNVSHSRLSGEWTGHDGSMLRIYDDGIGVRQFRVPKNCLAHPSPPCNSGSGSHIYPGGVIVFQLNNPTGNGAYGPIMDSSNRSSGSVTIIFHRSTDIITMKITGQAGSTTYCKTSASCRA